MEQTRVVLSSFSQPISLKHPWYYAGVDCGISDDNFSMTSTPLDGGYSGLITVCNQRQWILKIKVYMTLMLS